MDTYLPVIRQSFYLFPLIAALFTIPYMLYNYHKYGSVWSIRIIIIYSFILYLMTIFFLVTLPLPSRAYVASLQIERAQLEPLNFIRDIAREAKGQLILDDPDTWISLIHNQAFLQFAFNVVMIMPFGMYLHYYFKRSLAASLLLSFGLSLFFEVSQLTGLFFIYPRNYRLFDVDDLLANTLGGVLGWLAVTPFMGLLPKRKNIDAAAYRRGEKVSLLRRLMAAGVDGLCLLIGYILLEMLFPWLLHHGLLSWFLVLSVYFVLIPWFLKGRTFGMMANSTKLVQTGSYTQEDQRPTLGMLCLRYGLLSVFVMGLPWLMTACMDWMSSQGSSLFSSMLVLILFVIYLWGWGSIISSFLFAKVPFYGRISHTRIVSAIHAV